MRVLVIVLTILLAIGPSFAKEPHEQHHSECKVTPKDLSSGKEGEFGYLHDYLHRCGVIDDLRAKTQRTCCTLESQECGAAHTKVEIKANGEKWIYAELDGQWCPALGANAVDDMELSLVDLSVVCRSEFPPGPGVYNVQIGSEGRPCPSIYCVARPHLF
jgi:hypothetical protein